MHFSLYLNEAATGGTCTFTVAAGVLDLTPPSFPISMLPVLTSAHKNMAEWLGMVASWSCSRLTLAIGIRRHHRLGCVDNLSFWTAGYTFWLQLCVCSWMDWQKLYRKYWRVLQQSLLPWRNVHRWSQWLLLWMYKCLDWVSVSDTTTR